MDKIRNLVWNGTLNVQIQLDDKILINGLSSVHKLLNLRFPRDSYLTIYLGLVLQRIKDVVKFDIIDRESHFWFEYEGNPLQWNIPIGTLYDTVQGTNLEKLDENVLNIWKIRLCYGETIPSTVIPMISGVDQIQKYWMHQWKQASFTMNGSSKQVMSLTRSDSKLFWDSIINRNIDDFERIRKIVTSRTVRRIPVIFHYSNKVLQPVVNNDKALSLKDLAIDLFPELSGEDGLFTGKLISNGISILPGDNISDLYTQLLSFDGFLHIVVKA